MSIDYLIFGFLGLWIILILVVVWICVRRGEPDESSELFQKEEEESTPRWDDSSGVWPDDSPLNQKEIEYGSDGEPLGVDGPSADLLGRMAANEKVCELEECIGSRGPVLFRAMKAIGATTWGVGICSSCSKALGIYGDGAPLPPPEIVSKLLSEARAKGSTPEPEIGPETAGEEPPITVPIESPESLKELPLKFGEEAVATAFLALIGTKEGKPFCALDGVPSPDHPGSVGEFLALMVHSFSSLYESVGVGTVEENCFEIFLAGFMDLGRQLGVPDEEMEARFDKYLDKLEEEVDNEEKE